MMSAATSIANDVNPAVLPMVPGRHLPQNPDVEKAVLGAMMLSQDDLELGMARLKPSDFLSESHRLIFAAMRELMSRGKPVDCMMVASRLQATDRLERAGGSAYLIELSGNYFDLIVFEHYIDLLRSLGTLRELVFAGANIQHKATSGADDVHEVVDQCERLLMSVTEGIVSDDLTPVGNIAADVFVGLDDKADLGILTRIPTLDDKLGGLRPGQMVVVGARPGVGKTSFALTLALNMALRNVPVVFFSLEMSKQEVGQRIVANYTGIPLSKILRKEVTESQRTQIRRAAEELDCCDLLVDDTPGITVSEIRAKARRALRRKQGGVVIVDYLQLLSAPPRSRHDSRVTEVSEMSRGLKIMAKDLGAPVLALSQLSRQVESRTGKRPQLSDLRESGAIEQDADVVLLLDRSMDDEEASRADRPDRGVTRCIVAKNRSGALGEVDLSFTAETTSFAERDRYHHAA